MTIVIVTTTFLPTRAQESGAKLQRATEASERTVQLEKEIAGLKAQVGGRPTTNQIDCLKTMSISSTTWAYQGTAYPYSRVWLSTGSPSHTTR